MHIPKQAPPLGVGVPMDFWIFRERFQGSKFIRLKSSLYHWKALKTYMFKMILHDLFGYLKHKLWPKKRLEIKLPIWVLTTKSWESLWFTCMQVAWKDFNKGYNFSLNLTLIEGLHKKLWAFKVVGDLISGILYSQLRSPETKWHLDASPRC